jgi:hypothetical protein
VIGALEHTIPRHGLTLLNRALIGFALLLAMLVAGVQMARATEIIPSVGLTRAANGDGTNDLPFLMAEIGATELSQFSVLGGITFHSRNGR